MKNVMKKGLCMCMAAILLAGCGSAGGAQNGAASQGGGGGAEKDIVTIGVSGTPELDPAIANTNSGVQAMVNLYDTLVFPTKDGVEPRLAEKWDTSPDGLEYTFYLKKGVKFHNGEEMKAADVAFSMDRFLAIGEGYAYLFSDYIKSTEAPDDYTVKFHMKKPFGPFLKALVRFAVVSEKEIMDNKKDGPYGKFGDYGKAYLVTHDAGSGAYKAKELVQQDYFLAEKYDDWFMGWKNKLAPKGFKMYAITEASTVRTMMKNRQLDITDQWQSAETLAALEKMDGVAIGEYSTFLEYNMYFNTKLAPMDDINFRKAVSCLIDYDTICKSIFIDSEPSAGPVAARVWGAVKTNTMKYNLDQAKEYLSKSKYADTYPDYSIEILCNSDVSDLEKIALMIQSAGKKIGLKFEVSKAPWVSIIDRVGAQDTTPQMLAINSAPGYDEAGAYLESRYHSKTAGTWEQGEWLKDKKLDQMIEEAISTLDENGRLEKYARIQNYIVDDMYPTAYLCDMTERLAYNKSYLTWPAIEKTKDGKIPSALYGYLHIFADMQLQADKK